MGKLRSLEVCAGAGGQAIGLERAGFQHAGLVEIDSDACATIRLNRPKWKVIESDLRNFSGRPFLGIDLLAGGIPCPPFSIAGKQKGRDDERDLFPEMIRLARECKPKAILIENVKGLLSSVFDEYRKEIESVLRKIGYVAQWKLLNSSDFGVPQLRPRVAMVALRSEYAPYFKWPEASTAKPPTVGEALFAEIARNGWSGARDWKKRANKIAPTLVGGSKKHGGPDLGPSRARSAWAELGVNGKSLANEAPEKTFRGDPRLTLKMAALIQGFPPEWQFSGNKTSSYRQIGNAFPAPVAHAIGKAIARALEAGTSKHRGRQTELSL